MMSLFVSKLRVYYFFRNNPKILLLIVFKDIFFNLYFKISWFPTLALSSIVGVILYFLSLKLLGE